jgi:hypothetical protein
MGGRLHPYRKHAWERYPTGPWQNGMAGWQLQAKVDKSMRGHVHPCTKHVWHVRERTRVTGRHPEAHENKAALTGRGHASTYVNDYDPNDRVITDSTTDRYL